MIAAQWVRQLGLCEISGDLRRRTMKINIHIRERANMLPMKYWATLINALVVSLALLLLQPLGAAAGTVTFLDPGGPGEPPMSVVLGTTGGTLAGRSTVTLGANGES